MPNKRTIVKRFVLFLFFLAGIALAGWGWLRYQESLRPQQTVLTPNALATLNVAEENADEIITFVIAGRDRSYTRDAGAVIYDANGNPIGRRSEARSNAYGTNTDTVLYGVLKENELKLIAIPRDTWLPEYVTKINSMYHFQQGEGLARAVSSLVGLPAEYYIVINIDVFQRIVDALGGIELDVPYRMCYNDYAAQLHIDLLAGVQQLDGEDTAGFVRYRKGNCRSARTINDTDRLDNMQLVANAILARAKRLNVRAVGALDELVDTYQDEIETNADINLALRLIPRLSNMTLSTLTLPTYSGTAQSQIAGEPVTTSVEFVDRNQANRAIAGFFGGRAQDVAETVDIADVPVVIRNQSGVAGLGDYVKQHIVARGLPAHRVSVMEEARAESHSQVRAESTWATTATAYAQLLHLGYSQVTHFTPPEKSKAFIEITLGEDMRERYSSRHVLTEAKVTIPSASENSNQTSSDDSSSDTSTTSNTSNNDATTQSNRPPSSSISQDDNNPAADDDASGIIVTLP